MKQCWMQYIEEKNPKNTPVLFFVTRWSLVPAAPLLDFSFFRKGISPRFFVSLLVYLLSNPEFSKICIPLPQPGIRPKIFENLLMFPYPACFPAYSPFKSGTLPIYTICKTSRCTFSQFSKICSHSSARKYCIPNSVSGGWLAMPRGQQVDWASPSPAPDEGQVHYLAYWLDIRCIVPGINSQKKTIIYTEHMKLLWCWRSSPSLPSLDQQSSPWSPGPSRPPIPGTRGRRWWPSLLHLLSKAAILAAFVWRSLCVLARSGALLGLFIALDPQSTDIYRVQTSSGRRQTLDWPLTV